MFNILLCTKNKELTARFYQAAGVPLVLEKHGMGPEHFSLETPTVAEIYPPRTPEAGATIFRIDVADLESVMTGIKELYPDRAYIIADSKTLKTGKKAIVYDPDGRVVELFQAFTI